HCFVVAAGARNADIVVAAEIDLIVRMLLGILVDDEILGSEIGILLLDLDLLLGGIERHRLLGLEDRLRIPGDPAIDASHGVFLAEVVEAGAALGAGPLRAPFSLRHGSMSPVRKFERR